MRRHSSRESNCPRLLGCSSFAFCSAEAERPETENRNADNHGNCVIFFRFGSSRSRCNPRKKGFKWPKSLKPVNSLDSNPFPVSAGLDRLRKRNNPASGTANPSSREEVLRTLNFLWSKAVEYLMFASSSFNVCRCISLRASNKRRCSSRSFTLRILTIRDPS